MKIKAMISGFLAAAVLTAAPAYAMEKYMPFTDTDASKPEVLARLGIISGYEDGSFRPENTITRTEAVLMLMNLCFGAETTQFVLGDNGDFGGSFNDVPETYWAKNAIAYASTRAPLFISGYEDGSFRPDNNVTEEEFIKMLMCARGYREVCEIKGGYPKAYTDSAIKDGLCESVSSAPATREFAASAVYNSLSSTALVITGIVTVAPPERGGITQNYKNQPYGFLSVMNISVADGEIISAENGKLKVKVTEVQECINDIADEYAEGPDIVKIPRLKAGEIYEMDVKYSDIYESYAEALKNGTVPAARLLIKDNSEKTDGNLTKAFTLLSEFKGEADQ